MDFYFKLKHWQVFFIQIIGLVLLYVSFSDPFLTKIVHSVSFVLIHLWIIIIGLETNNYVSEAEEKSNAFFLLNIVLVIGLYIFLIMSGINNITVTGWYALIGFYFIFAFLQIYIFGANSLNRLYRTAGRKEEESSISLFFMLLFWPIGIWIIQPKINKVIQRVELIEREED
ncbi:hypothetical protein [Flammeovirga sp. SJP92]|uniref:hypothetical protein n=1 Tax=Flammeovirga sp. SJP92 TaxID=1775430 RepID=UPI0007885A93|nr:hypothetical protein [Flammeovirga sp. SJP92]KXX71552.1 hypothetical protein AVL50_04580 [Flammeovirga sp. SJP92]